MYIYILSFALSILLIYIGNLACFESHIGKVMIIVGLLIPILLATYRSLYVGTDTLVYIKPTFDAAIWNSNYNGYMNYIIPRGRVADIEIGYTSFIYFVAKIFGNFQLLLFLSQCLINLNVYLSLKKTVKKNTIWLGMTIYYLLFFNMSLNAARQTIAMSFILLATAFFMEKKLLRSLLLILVSFLFHKSAIIGIISILIYLVAFEMNKESKIKFKSISKKRVLIFLVIEAIVIFAPNAILFMLNLLSFQNYANYFSGSTNFSISQLLMRFPLVLFILLHWRQLSRNPIRFYYTAIAMSEIILSQIATRSTYAIRLDYYLQFFYVIGLPYIIGYDSDSNMSVSRIDVTKFQKKHIFCIIAILYLIFYWYIQNVYLGYNDTIPYKLF